MSTHYRHSETRCSSFSHSLALDYRDQIFNDPIKSEIDKISGQTFMVRRHSIHCCVWLNAEITDNLQPVTAMFQKKNIYAWTRTHSLLSTRICALIHYMTLHYIKLQVKNAPKHFMQSLYRHLKIYSEDKRWKRCKEQMRFQFIFEGLQGIWLRQLQLANCSMFVPRLRWTLSRRQWTVV